MSVDDVPLGEAMFCWNPGTGEVAVGVHSNMSGWSDHYLMSDGACWVDWSTVTLMARLQHLMTMFAVMANHASIRTTQFYDRRSDEVTLDEVDRVLV